MPEFDTTLVWLRPDLRPDNHAVLYQALKSSPGVVPAFIFDSEIRDALSGRADRRVEFIRGN